MDTDDLQFNFNPLLGKQFGAERAERLGARLPVAGQGPGRARRRAGRAGLRLGGHRGTTGRPRRSRNTPLGPAIFLKTQRASAARSASTRHGCSASAGLAERTSCGCGCSTSSERTSTPATRAEPLKCSRWMPVGVARGAAHAPAGRPGRELAHRHRAAHVDSPAPGRT